MIAWAPVVRVLLQLPGIMTGEAILQQPQTQSSKLTATFVLFFLFSFFYLILMKKVPPSYCFSLPLYLTLLLLGTAELRMC